MSQFYAEIQGNRGGASRGGSKNSGIDGHLRGWSNGVRVVGRHNKETGKDEFSVYKTSGSNGSKPEELIATV